MAPRITTVLFDLGDTLWHFPNMPPRDIRLAVEEETSRAFHGDGVDPGYPELCRRVAAQHDLDLSPEQGEELWEAWNLGGAFLGRVLFADVLPTLQWLRDRGIRIASVTNRGYSGPRFHEEMRDLGLEDLFETTVISCDAGYMKPHPRIFEIALEKLGVEAEGTAMVGDSLRADVEGAKALGMTAIWRRPPAGEPVEETEDKPEPGSVTPDYTINDIGELKGLPIFSDASSTK
jgi:HAD superfamily hydrolase (TIGR01549 family)